MCGANRALVPMFSTISLTGRSLKIPAIFGLIFPESGSSALKIGFMIHLLERLSEYRELDVVQRRAVRRRLWRWGGLVSNQRPGSL